MKRLKQLQVEMQATPDLIPEQKHLPERNMVINRSQK